MSFIELIDHFRPKWKNSSLSVREDAVKTLTKQPLLARIARSDPDSRVRKAAVERLTDQKVLAEIANHASSEVRRAAVQRLTDQEVLAEIAKDSGDRSFSDVLYRAQFGDVVRRAAVQRLTDQKVLTEIAESRKFEGIREAAVERLTDQTVLAKIARTEADNRLRFCAVKGLTDQAALAEVAESDLRPEVRLMAVTRLKDDAVLLQFAKSHRDIDVRKAAAKLVHKGGAHVWADDCKVCSICGEASGNSHDWHGCRCSRCRQLIHDPIDCKCSRCGATIHHFTHGRCSGCHEIERNFEGFTALHRTIIDLADSRQDKVGDPSFEAGKKTEIVELCKNGLVNVADYSGFTPLMVAAGRGHMDVLEILLAYGDGFNCRQVYFTAHQSAGAGGNKRLWCELDGRFIRVRGNTQDRPRSQ